MDDDEHRRTEEAANKLRELIKYSIDLYSKQDMPYEAYHQKLRQIFGPLDSYPQWKLINLNHLNTIYETMNRGAKKTPQAITALNMLNKFLPRDGEAPKKPNAGQQNRTHSHDENDGADEHVSKKQKGPDYSSVPPEIEVLCNNKPATLLIRTQTVICHCEVCSETAAALGKPHLELSLNEFERHCGVGHVKKWKFSVKTVDPPNMSVGKWLESKRLKLNDYPRSTPDDEILRQAEQERTMKIPPELRAPDRIPRKPGHTGATSPEEVEQVEGVANGRAQRQRKVPGWMKQTVDPAVAIGGKGSRPQGPVGGDSWEPPQPRGGPRGGVGHRGPGRPPGTRRPGRPPGPVIRPQSAHAQIIMDQAHGRKRPRIDSDALLEAEIDVALARGKQPEMHGWRITDQNQLAVTVHLGGVVFSGVLPARPPQVASNPAIAAALMRDQHTYAPEDAYGYESNPEFGAGRDNGAGDSGGFSGLPAAGARGGEMGLDDGYGGGGGLVSEKELRLDEKRAIAAAEYDRLLVSGPPSDAKCAMCHLEAADDVPRHARGPDGKSQVGLGSFILIRTSTVTNGWVHDQCARWSPDVYDPTGEGILEGIPEAVRRGRMLRCKTCGEKGATLGCMKRTCRSSYHLDCARKHGCLLNVDPYAVACPEHVEHLPDGLSYKLGFKGRGKRTFIAENAYTGLRMVENGIEDSGGPGGPYAVRMERAEVEGGGYGSGGGTAPGGALDALGAIAASIDDLKSSDGAHE